MHTWSYAPYHAHIWMLPRSTSTPSGCDSIRKSDTSRRIWPIGRTSGWSRSSLPFMQRQAYSALFPLSPLTAIQRQVFRSEEHTSELQSLMRISYAVLCLKKKKNQIDSYTHNTH